MTLARRRVRAALGLFVTGLFLWLALRRVDVNQTMAAAAKVRPALIAVALTYLAAGYGARVFRWWWMLRRCNRNLALRACFWPLIVSVSVNNVVPFRAGDALRVFGFQKQLGASAPRLFGTLLVERLLDATALLVLLLLGLAMLHGFGSSTIYRQIATGVAGITVLTWSLICLWSEQLEQLIIGFCKSTSSPWARARESQVRQLFLALDPVRTSAGALQLLAMSIAVWTCEGAVYATIATGLHYDGRPFGPWFSCATGTLSTLVPSSPGYIGTFDYFAMSGLIAYGASRVGAAAFAFLVHAVLWIPLTAAGLIYLVAPRLGGPRSTTTPEEHEEERA